MYVVQVYIVYIMYTFICLRYVILRSYLELSYLDHDQPLGNSDLDQTYMTHNITYELISSYIITSTKSSQSSAYLFKQMYFFQKINYCNVVFHCGGQSGPPVHF